MHDNESPNAKDMPQENAPDGSQGAHDGGLTQADIYKGLRSLLADGIASQAMGTLTGGAFLVAFAIHLGASNLVIGLLAAIGPLAQLLQLPGIYLVEILKKRKPITLIAAGISRSCWVLIALSPFLFKAFSPVSVLLWLLIIASMTGAVAGCSWNSWMRDLIPEKILGTFFAKRMRLATVSGIVMSLGAAAFIDYWKTALPGRETSGYSVLFLTGYAAGLIGLGFISRIPEPRMASEGKFNLFSLLLTPFRDKNYRRLISFLCTWNFAINLAAPFFMVYMLKRLGLSMTWVIGLSILSQVMNFVFFGLWGKYTDMFSNKSVLAICAPLFIFSIAAWPFTTLPNTYALTVPLLVGIHIVMGVSSAGIALASGNIGLKLAPKGKATAYLATNTIMNSMAAGIAPIIGGKFADFFTNKQLSVNITFTDAARSFSISPLNLQHWDFFFIIAFIIGFLSLNLLIHVREVGEVDEKIVTRQLMAEVRSQVRILSSVEGLRFMVTFPFGVLRQVFGRKTPQPPVNSDSPSDDTSSGNVKP